MRLTTFLASVLLIVLGYWAYHQTIQTQMAAREVDALHRTLAQERERLSVLRAEWAYLNRPDRLRELAMINFDRLRLLPLAPEQFGVVAEIPYPPPPPPAGDLLARGVFGDAGTAPAGEEPL